MVTVNFHNFCQNGHELEATGIRVGSLSTLLHKSRMVFLRKILMQLFVLQLKYRHCWRGDCILLNNQGYRDFTFWQTFTLKRWGEHSTLRKKLRVFIADDKIQALEQILEFWKFSICFLIPKTFLMKLTVGLTNVTFLGMI